MGRAIKALRERQRMSQQAAADAMGVTKTAWQNYENGRDVILKTTVQQQIATALGSTRQELLLQLAALTPAGERSGLTSLGFEESGPAADPFRNSAVFPLREGDVTVTYPSDLSRESFDQLEIYLTNFLRARRPKDA